MVRNDTATVALCYQVLGPVALRPGLDELSRVGGRRADRTTTFLQDG